MQLEKYGFSSRLIAPQGNSPNGVMIVGEAPGQEEDRDGIPFNPYAQAGSVLERAIRRLGYNRDQFVITNVVPFRPPNNWLEGAPWEDEAIEAGRAYLDEAIAKYRPRAIVALGSVATREISGLAGAKLGVTNLTGFVLPSPRYGIPVIPNLHPSFLRRGKMSHFGVFMNSLRKTIRVAAENIQPILPPIDNTPPRYQMTPTEDAAEKFYRDSMEARYIAYDIETPYSVDEESAEEAEGEQAIKSIQFSIAQGSGIFFHWREPYITIAKRILALPNPKLCWNGWKFDDPILRSQDVVINGERNDLMWAWHHCQPDLKNPGMGLQFVAAQLGWPWPWKHLAMANEQFYGIVDVDILQWMVQ